MSSKRSRAPRRKSSMKKLFSKNRKFGGDADVSAMSTQELSYHGKMDELQAKISSGASNVEGDYFALPPWNAMTNIQAALKGIDADKKKGTDDPTNTVRMDIIMYLIENEAKTDYLFNYLKQYPLSKGYLTVWMDRLLETGAHDDLVESLAEIQTSTDSTPSVATKDYKAEMNAIFVTKKNTDPNASMNMLFTVAKDGSPDNMTKMILNYRQDINAVDESTKTPLMVAAENGNVGVVKVIFENEKIQKKLLENRQDKEGDTALTIACNVQPVNKEVVEYLAGKVDVKIINNNGDGAHDILERHKKYIDDKINTKEYANATTNNTKLTDKAQVDVLSSLIKTVKAKMPDKANPAVQSKNQPDQKKLLLDRLLTYVDDNFKDKYLQFIDVEMRKHDPNWKYISSCKTYWRKTCNKPADMNSAKQNLYSIVVKHYNDTRQIVLFKTLVENRVLSDVDANTKTIIMKKIKDDIDRSEQELTASYDNTIISMVKAFAGGSRRSKKRSASKTRKQKK